VSITFLEVENMWKTRPMPQKVPASCLGWQLVSAVISLLGTCASMLLLDRKEVFHMWGNHKGNSFVASLCVPEQVEALEPAEVILITKRKYFLYY